MFNFAFGELYPGGKHHLRQCDRLSVRLFRSGRDGERKCCSVPCNANSVTAFSLLYHPQYALVTSNVTWQLYAAVDLVCAMYLLVYRRFWFRSRLVYPDEFVLSECAGWLLSLHSARFPAVDEPPFATITSTSQDALNIRSAACSKVTVRSTAFSVSTIFLLRPSSSFIHLLPVTSNYVF